MNNQKVIAVVGATGAQGGGLARAILNDPNSEFSVRAITRDPNSDKAKELAALGAEVVTADSFDVDSLTKAFEGAYGAYCVTFFWAHMDPDKEKLEAKNMAQAAKNAGVEHIVWSTLDDTRKFVPLDDERMPTLLGKYKVPHFDAKAEADEYFKDLPATFLLTTFYWDNFIHFGSGPQPAGDGKYAITMPMGDKKLAGIASEDIGKCAYGIFKRPELIGKTIGVAGEMNTVTELASDMTNALGVDVVYNSVTPDAFRALGFPGADEMGNMFQFYADFEDYFHKTRSPDFSRVLNPELQDFETWLAKNSKAIPLPQPAGAAN